MVASCNTTVAVTVLKVPSSVLTRPVTSFVMAGIVRSCVLAGVLTTRRVTSFVTAGRVRPVGIPAFFKTRRVCVLDTTGIVRSCVRAGVFTTRRSITTILDGVSTLLTVFDSKFGATGTGAVLAASSSGLASRLASPP